MAEGGPAPGFLIDYSDGVVQSVDPGLSSLTLTRARPLDAGAWVGAPPSGSVLRALAAPALSAASSEWPTAEGSEFAQNRALGVYTDPDLAARELPDQLWLLSVVYEWGALVCESGGRYTWSRMVTSRDSGTVETRKLASCGGATTWANLHSHTSDGMTTPSWGDVAYADAEPSMRFYVATPAPNHAEPEPWKWRHQGPNSNWTAVRWNGTNWVITPFH